GDDPVDVVVAGGAGAGRLRPGRADASDDVDLLDDDAGRVLRDPVRRAVVDRVARRAAGAQELPLRSGEVTDGGDVLVAVLVDLGGAHHHVPLAVGDDVEDASEWNPALDHVALGEPGRWAGQ